ncbi:MAG: urease accessory protein UreF [Labrys sp. (in: a-proteobacteria)]|jgi:urease accessory protein
MADGVTPLEGGDRAGQLARLILWFSPAFPTGAFSFSHGLEWAVEAGDVHDRASLEIWLDGLLRHGSGWSDAVLMAAAHRAVTAGDVDGLADLAALALALQPTRERRLETAVQGEAFLKAVEVGWSGAATTMLRQALPHAPPLAIAVGATTAGAGIEVETAITAALTGFCANLVSASVRLAPIGQSDGLRVLSALEGRIARTASRAAIAPLSAVGGCAFRSDIASMRHETQETRLFRS